MECLGALPRLRSDRMAMEQIFGNLLSNAVKYLDPRRPGVVSIDGHKDPVRGVVTLHVKDNGRGIAQTDVAKVFSLFKRVGKLDQEGEGMGLAYVQTLVRRLEGRITCVSTLDQGTVFHVTLPSALPNAG